MHTPAAPAPAIGVGRSGMGANAEHDESPRRAPTARTDGRYISAAQSFLMPIGKLLFLNVGHDGRPPDDDPPDD